MVYKNLKKKKNWRNGPHSKFIYTMFYFKLNLINY